MFQTVTPFAVRQNLTVNSKFADDDVTDAAKEVLTRKGLVLMVWEHTQIAPLAQALGVPNPTPWAKDDFDSIWILTPTDSGTATMTVDHEQISPSAKCSF
jgi:hypothetical protein